MDTPVLVALVAAVTGLVTSVVSLLAQRSTAERQGQTQLEVLRLGEQLDRQKGLEACERDAAEELARYREPLLDATRDLLHRVSNVRLSAFLGYLDAPPPRPKVALQGTLFRFAKYWGTVERLYGTVSLLALESNASTKHIADLLTNIGRRFADDSAGEP